MDTNKAAYWIALGVLALGLNSEYRKGNLVALHRVADRAGAELCRLSMRAEEAVLLATGVTTRRAILPDNVLAVADRGEMAREQADMIREQVRNEILAQREVLRARAEMQRAEIEQLRLRTRSEFRLASTAARRVVVCPKTGTRVVVDAGAESSDASPDVEIEDNF